MTAVHENEITLATELLNEQDADDLERLVRLKATLDELQDEYQFLSRQLAEILGRSRVEMLVDGVAVTVTPVHRKPTVTVNVESLALVNPALADRVSKRVVDTKRLERERAKGYFSPDSVEAGFLQITPVSPYLRFTRKDEHGSQE